MITFRQMEIFAGIVAHGSFRRCAVHLGISPEAVSANMRALEDNLGYHLFERRPGGPALLTSLGQRAFQHASNILDDLSYLYDTSEGSTSRKIVLGAHPYIMRYLQPGIDAFRAQHPEVILELDIDGSVAPDFPQKVARRAVDLAYYFAFEHDELEAKPFTATMAQEPLAIFMARDHPLVTQSSITRADLSALPVVHLSQRTALRPLIDRALEAYGLGHPPVAVESDDYGLILTSVRRGQGFGCLFASTGDDIGGADAMVMLPMEQPLPNLLIRRIARNLHRGALVTELERSLRGAFRGLPPG